MNDRGKPAGDQDLSGARARMDGNSDANIRDGGVGPDGTDFMSVGDTGGVKDTSDGKNSSGDFATRAAPAASMSGNVLDTDRSAAVRSGADEGES